MRETAKSLLWYFLIAGVFLLYSTGVWGAITGAIPVIFLVSGSFIVVANRILNLALGIGYLYFGLALPTYLHPGHAKNLERFIIGAFVLYTTLSLLDLMRSGLFFTFAGIAIDALLTWYLFRNVRRLSQDPA